MRKLVVEFSRTIGDDEKFILYRAFTAVWKIAGTKVNFPPIFFAGRKVIAPLPESFAHEFESIVRDMKGVRNVQYVA